MMIKIVILGAGFGGLTAAMKLGGKIKNGTLKDCELTLVDKNSYHTYTPTLYEAATTSKETANYIGIRSIVTFPLGEILKGLPVRIVDDEALSVEAGAKTAVRLKNGEKLECDYLILALGSVTNYFGIPGLEEAALKMKTFNHSMEIREAVWSEISMGEGKEAKQPLKIVIGGGGSTGVELAGELRVWLNQLGKKHKRDAQVSIIEANPTVLFGFDEKVARSVSARLMRLGVSLMTGKAIKSVSAKDKKITTTEGAEIDYDILIWTGGVKPNPILENMPIKMERGRAGVASGMACMPKESDLSPTMKIFAIGDMVCFIDPKTTKPVPLVAEAAINQAKVAAKNIEMEIKDRQHIFYSPGDFPYVIPIGGKYAVAKLGPIIIKGFLGWLLKGLVELKYLLSIMPFFKAMKIWFKGLMIFVKNDRLG